MAGESPRRTIVLLCLGAAAGLGTAAGGLIGPSRASQVALPPDTVAQVNGRGITKQAYLRALAALSSDRRNPIDLATKRRALEKLIDEELLVQRGLELDLVRSDRRVRGDLLSAVIAAAVSQAGSREPTASEVRAFYRNHRDYFTRPGRLWVRQIFVRDHGRAPEPLARARKAAERLRAGEPFAAVQRELGDRELAPLPDGPLTPTKLREYLGPTAVRTALSMPVGSVSEPVRSSGGFHVLQLLERGPARIPPLREIDAEVRAEMRRRAEDRALRTYLDDLRQQADLRVAERLP